MATGVHLSPSERHVFAELQAHPEKRYDRSGAELRALARQHGYTNVVTLDNTLRNLANKGLVVGERAGRRVLYYAPDTSKAIGVPAENARAVALRGEVQLKYTVGFSMGEDGYVVASVPALPGCHSQGRTIEEARRNIREAMQGYLASLQFLGEPIPAEETVEQIEVSV